MKKAIIILHEIYGINQFIKDQCRYYENNGFDVFCPNLTGRVEPYSYEEEGLAYENFMAHHGLDRFEEIKAMIDQLKEEYRLVFILGFSVGGTIAFRCCENKNCDGIVAIYGSRIRDYTDLKPVCPVSLLFATQDSFPVSTVVETLQSKSNVSCHTYDAAHGFMDPYCRKFNESEQEIASQVIHNFFGK